MIYDNCPLCPKKKNYRETLRDMNEDACMFHCVD